MSNEKKTACFNLRFAAGNAPAECTSDDLAEPVETVKISNGDIGAQISFLRFKTPLTYAEAKAKVGNFGTLYPIRYGPMDGEKWGKTQAQMDRAMWICAKNLLDELSHTGKIIVGTPKLTKLSLQKVPTEGKCGKVGARSETSSVASTTDTELVRRARAKRDKARGARN